MNMTIFDLQAAQLAPIEATHHIQRDGKPVFFRNDTKPNQKFVNGKWVEMYADANVARWAAPVGKPAIIRNTVKRTQSEIYPRKHISDAFQGD